MLPVPIRLQVRTARAAFSDPIPAEEDTDEPAVTRAGISGRHTSGTGRLAEPGVGVRSALAGDAGGGVALGVTAVPAAAAVEEVSAPPTRQDVVRATAGERVLAGPAEQPVATTAPADRVIAAGPADDVNACGAGQDVSTRGPRDRARDRTSLALPARRTTFADPYGRGATVVDEAGRPYGGRGASTTQISGS